MSRKATIVLIGAAAMLGAASAAAFTREPVMPFDKSIGHTQVDDIEGGIASRRDADGRRTEVRGPFGRPVATAIGNLINIEAGPNSTVVLNALQINRGNQTAINGELNLD